LPVLAEIAAAAVKLLEGRKEGKEGYKGGELKNL